MIYYPIPKSELESEQTEAKYTDGTSSDDRDQAVDLKPEKNDANNCIDQKLIVGAGALGGMGSVFVRLLEIEGDSSVTGQNEIERNSSVTGQNEIEGDSSVTGQKTSNPSIDWIPSVDVSLFNFWAICEFSFFLGISVFLGAISGFILVNMGGISIERKNQSRCLSTAMVFGLFFPSSVQLMKQNFDSQATIMAKQRQVNVLEEKKDVLVDQNNALTKGNIKVIESLTGTAAAQDNIGVKEDVLEAYINVFWNTQDSSKQISLLDNIAGVGINNVVENFSITQNAGRFLQSIKDNPSLDISVRDKAKSQLIVLQEKCEEEKKVCS